MSSMSSESSRAPELRRDSPEPLHEQLAAHLRARIQEEEWPLHHKLPAEPELARTFAVSRGTLRRAIRTLIEEGLLVQVHGRGTFVGATGIEQPIAQQMSSLAQALSASGIRFATRVRDLRIEPPPERIGELLVLPRGDACYRLERLRSTEDGVLALLVNYLPTHLCPELDRNDLEHRSLYAVLEHDYRLTLASARRTFEATAARGSVAEALDVPAGHPVLYLEQVTRLQDDTPIEYSDVWIRGDRLRLTSMLTREENPSAAGQDDR